MKKPVDELFGVQHSRKFISNLHGLFTGNCVFIGLQYKAKVRVNEIWAYLKSLSFRFCFFFVLFNLLFSMKIVQQTNDFIV